VFSLSVTAGPGASQRQVFRKRLSAYEASEICAFLNCFIAFDRCADLQVRFNGEPVIGARFWNIGIYACDLSREVCAKLFPIWTVVIDHLPAQLSLESPWFHVDFLAQIGLER
jgi:hypothetical protein